MVLLIRALGLALTAPAVSAGGTPTPQRVAVLPTLLDARAARELPSLFDDLILNAVEEAGPFSAIGRHDVEALLDFEAQRALLDCEPTVCWVDLAGAMGADLHLLFRVVKSPSNDWIAVGRLGHVHSDTLVHLRSVVVQGGPMDFLRQITSVVRELLQTPAPAPVVLPSFFQARVESLDPSHPRGKLCAANDAADCEAQCLLRNAPSCERLGAMYLTGHDVPRVWDKAAIFFEQGCGLGSPSACNSLGVLHHFGFGTDEDPKQARSLFERACIASDDLACEHLWRLYLRPTRAFTVHM